MPRDFLRGGSRSDQFGCIRENSALRSEQRDRNAAQSTKGETVRLTEQVISAMKDLGDDVPDRLIANHAQILESQVAHIREVLSRPYLKRVANGDAVLDI